MMERRVLLRWGSCVILVAALALLPHLASAQTEKCNTYASNVAFWVVKDHRDKEALSTAGRVYSYWRAREAQLLAEQTSYSRSHLEPSPAIQKALDYAQSRVRSAKQSAGDAYSNAAEDHNQAIIAYRDIEDGGCVDSTWDYIRGYLEKYPGALASTIRNIHAKPLAPLGKWDGEYTNSDEVVIVHARGALSASWRYTEPGHDFNDQGSSGNYDSCKEESADSLRCEIDGQYHDADKDIEYKGSATLTFSGNELTISGHLTRTSCMAKKVSNCSQLGYTPAIHAGADFTTTLTKQ